MKNVKNLKLCEEAESLLASEEIEVIIAIVLAVRNHFSRNTSCGTFILSGKRFGEDARCIVRFDLEDGCNKKKYRHNGVTGQDNPYWYSTSAVASRTVREFIKTINSAPVEAQSAFPSGGVLVSDSGDFLVHIRAANGHFIISFDTPDHKSRFNELVMFAVAQALAIMIRDDLTLHEQWRAIYHAEENNNRGMFKKVCEFVDKLFVGMEIPEIDAWFDWYGLESDEITLLI